MAAKFPVMIGVKVSVELAKLLETRAAREDRSMSQIVRRLIEAEARRRVQPVREQDE
jgi:Ribbon-helix-helix protein, copG family